MNKYYYIFIFAVILASLGQIALKSGASKKNYSLLKQYINQRVIMGYLLMFCSMSLNIFTYYKVPLKSGPAIDSLGFLFVPILSNLIFKEKLSTKRIIGFFMITIGVFIFIL